MLRCWIAVAAFVIAFDATALTFSATVVRVADGDSLQVRDESGRTFHIRLSGIDAPERPQRFGSEARGALTEMLMGRRVVVDVHEPDRHGRLVGRVVRDDVDVALAQLDAGMAWLYPWAEALPDAERQRYSAAERRARSARAGLWADAQPVAPWVFRRQSRESVRATGPIVGNRRSKVYHRPGCPGYTAVSPKNRVTFATPADAEKAGYRIAKNCDERSP